MVVDKPAGFTSFDVVAKLRGICKTRKIGHGGTLDPMATGVLPVFIGPAAKAVDLQPRQDKTYEAIFLFGMATDTGDITGTTIQSAPETMVEEAQLREVLPRFVGARQQLPPMYSAVKIRGKPLYRYAREGKQVERKPREITIHSLELLEPVAVNHFKVRVHCSKGTYIRTLAEEVGAALGVPATLAALRRVGAGVFTIDAAHTLEEIQLAKEQGKLEELLCSLETIFSAYPLLELGDEAAQKLLHGAQVTGEDMPPGFYRSRWNNQFLGIVQVMPEGQLRGKKLFIERSKLEI